MIKHTQSHTHRHSLTSYAMHIPLICCCICNVHDDISASLRVIYGFISSKLIWIIYWKLIYNSARSQPNQNHVSSQILLFVLNFFSVVELWIRGTIVNKFATTLAHDCVAADAVSIELSILMKWHTNIAAIYRNATKYTFAHETFCIVSD